MVVGVATLAGWLFSREPKTLPWHPLVLLLAIFAAWVSITTLFAAYPDQAQWKFKRFPWAADRAIMPQPDRAFSFAVPVTGRAGVHSGLATSCSRPSPFKPSATSRAKRSLSGAARSTWISARLSQLMARETMTLPNFLGIGAPRAGTTWLHELLAAHPAIYLPPAKEIYFFSRYYERGTAWYENFFPKPLEAARYKAIGEFTPEYLSSEGCMERISELGTIDRFIVALRDPVRRTISHYQWLRGRRNYRGGLVEFCRDNPWVVGRSRYAEPLARYFARFGRDRFLILIFEEMIRDVSSTKETLASHLGVDLAGFAAHSGERRVNEVFDVTRPHVASVLARTALRLRSHNAFWVISALRAVGADRHLVRWLTGAKPRCTTLLEDEVHWLSDMLAPEVGRTEALLGRSIPSWHSPT